MDTTSMNLTILSALHSVKSVEHVPSLFSRRAPKFLKSLVGYFATPRLQKLSSALAESCHMLQIVALEIRRNENTDLIDPDLEKRDSLDTTKQFLLKQRAELSKSYGELEPDGVAPSKLHKEVATVISLMVELYEIANELQWAIAEHDATYSTRRQGYMVCNADELNAMLDRISAGT